MTARNESQLLENIIGKTPDLDLLSPRERAVIECRYYTEEERQKLEKCGRSLGITRERCRQLEVRALRRLRGELPKYEEE